MKPNFSSFPYATALPPPATVMLTQVICIAALAFSFVSGELYAPGEFPKFFYGPNQTVIILQSVLDGATSCQ